MGVILIVAGGLVLGAGGLFAWGFLRKFVKTLGGLPFSPFSKKPKPYKGENGYDQSGDFPV